MTHFLLLFDKYFHATGIKIVTKIAANVIEIRLKKKNYTCERSRWSQCIVNISRLVFSFSCMISTS